MQREIKPFVKKAAVIFIGTMVFFTFASRSIHYFMTPKVVATAVSSGYIRTSYMVDSLDLYSGDCIPVAVPIDMDKPIGVSKEHIEPGSTVFTGDRLVTFEESSFNSVFLKVRQEYESKRVEFLELERAYDERKKALERDTFNYRYELGRINDSLLKECRNTEQLMRLEREEADIEERLDTARDNHEELRVLFEMGSAPRNELEKSQGNIQKLEEELDDKRNEYITVQKRLIEEYTLKKKDYEFNLDRAQGQLDYLNTARIINGRSLELIQDELHEAGERLSVLEKTKEDGYTVRATTDGIVGKIYIEGGMYRGPDIILNIVPAGTHVMLALSFNEKDYESIDSGGVYGLIMDETGIPVEKAGTAGINGKRHVLFNTGESRVVDYEELLTSRVMLEARGGYCDAVIPNSALFESDKVYILEKRQGFWGEEYYALEQQVRTGQYNEQHTEITSGLRRNDRVITGWDREITDGARVMLPVR